MSALWSEVDITRTRRTSGGHHCGSSSFGKLFIPLGTVVLTAVKSLLSEPGLGATTLTPTTRTAVDHDEDNGQRLAHATPPISAACP
jgi:hypothetical protein